MTPRGQLVSFPTEETFVIDGSDTTAPATNQALRVQANHNAHVLLFGFALPCKMSAMRRLAPATVFGFCILASAAYGSGRQGENLPLPVRGQAHSAVSVQEIEALKPLALKDLLGALREGSEQPGHEYVREQFRRCKFRKLALGKLGAGVLMEFHDPTGGPNSGSYFVYLHRDGGYSRIAQGGGFGPYVLTGINGIPDLAFGSTSGVCTENFLRLRYSGNRYKPDACMQNVPDANSDDCHAEPCNDSRKLPMFPEPDPATLQ